jgi:hypothetical protein
MRRAQERLLSLATEMDKQGTCKQVDGKGNGLRLLEMKPVGNSI